MDKILKAQCVVKKGNTRMTTYLSDVSNITKGSQISIVGKKGVWEVLTIGQPEIINKYEYII